MIIDTVFLFGPHDFFVDFLEQVGAAVIVLALGVAQVGGVSVGGREHIDGFWVVGGEWVFPGYAADVAEAVLVAGVAQVAGLVGVEVAEGGVV